MIGRQNLIVKKYAAVGDLKRMSLEAPREPQAAYFCPGPAAGREEPTPGATVLPDVSCSLGRYELP